MFEEFTRERKEKDKARWRSYVRVVTNMGGSLNLELFCEKVRFLHPTLKPSLIHVAMRYLMVGTENLL